MKGIIGQAMNYLDWHEVKDNTKLTKLFAHNVRPIDPAKIAWCASFVEAVLLKCGVAGTGKLTARSYLKWGNPVSIRDSESGDIVILKRGFLPWQGHVGFLLMWNNNGDPVLIGGNQGNKVCRVPYPKNKILGIRRK
jgi:uncharacterized protein (TIGR02594 family)